MSLKKLKLNRWVSLGLLVVFIIALYLSLNKAVVPFIEEVAQSSLYMKETTDDDPLGEIRNARTDQAQLHCENQLREDQGAAAVPTSTDTNYKAWSIGDFTYVIKGSLDLAGENGEPGHYRYACKIHWNGKDMTDPDNWSTYGMDISKG
ncbi:MAG TPA: hypothetical protein VI457_13270 [Methylococcaceae bacterium]|nr:hypothetical protein [Methylococcaceae bacterium]